MWGIIPAAGSGTRIQPLAFSKELLPVGSRREDGTERPRAVSEYLVDRMLAGGADKLCFVISPGKWDILRYYGSDVGGASIAYVVQPRPAGLCDAIFRAVPLPRPARRVSRHAHQRVPRPGRRGTWCAGGERLRGCRHAPRLPRRARAAADLPAGQLAPLGRPAPRQRGGAHQDREQPMT